MTTTDPHARTVRVGDLDLTRIGYGAMQLTGPHVFGPPADRAAAVALLREAVELGVNHVDTADFYGPHVTNEILREALHPYDGVHVVTKVGVRRDDQGGWHAADSAEELTAQVHDNLQRLGLDVLDVVNVRLMGPAAEGHGSIAAQVEALAALRESGLVRHVGLSSCNAEQLAEAREIVPVVCVQNHYSLVERRDDELVAITAEAGIAFVPFWPLDGLGGPHAAEISAVARDAGASDAAVLLAWLLQRSPNVVLIPGTSSSSHLRDNLSARDLTLSADVVQRLDAIGGSDAG